MSAAPPEPDTKDWTWVLDRACPDCGVDASAIPADRVVEQIRADTRRWAEVLDRSEVAVRPAPHVWSPLEYACHVRDVHLLFADRLAQMLAEDSPTFVAWDQDVAARGYADAQAQIVVVEVLEAAARAAAGYHLLGPADWSRTGRRGDGYEFTALSLARYHLHDVAHHLADVHG